MKLDASVTRDIGRDTNRAGFVTGTTLPVSGGAELNWWLVQALRDVEGRAGSGNDAVERP